MALIRARQRPVTAVFPHQGNATHIVPSRRKPEPAPPPAPEPPPASPWPTHALAEAWLDQFTSRTGIGSPLDWAPGATLAQKFAAALRLWEDYTS